MMNVTFWSFKEEEGVVVDKILAAIHSREGYNIFAVLIMNNLILS
jgi:hypothetical protein